MKRLERWPRRENSCREPTEVPPKPLPNFREARQRSRRNPKAGKRWRRGGRRKVCGAGFRRAAQRGCGILQRVRPFGGWFPLRLIPNPDLLPRREVVGSETRGTVADVVRRSNRKCSGRESLVGRRRLQSLGQFGRSQAGRLCSLRFPSEHWVQVGERGRVGESGLRHRCGGSGFRARPVCARNRPVAASFRRKALHCSRDRRRRRAVPRRHRERQRKKEVWSSPRY